MDDKMLSKLIVLGYRIEYDENKNSWILYGASKNKKVIYVPDGIDEIADWAFANNDSLTEIRVSRNLKRIGHCAFLNCKNVKSLSIMTDNENTNNYDNVDDFIKKFDGVVESGAFENCYGNSILVKRESVNDEEAHLRFEAALAPYPFYDDCDKTIFFKILSGDEDGKLHISLINYGMMLYDMQYFNMENHEDEKHYYRPFFYEFITDQNETQFSEFVKKHLDRWMVGKVMSCKENTTYEYSFDGEVIFSASPIKYERMKLVILDRLASKEVCDSLKKTYELTNAINVNSQNKQTDLNPILDPILDKTEPEYIKIYNVGQAACNYIYFNNKKKVMFDVGYGYRKDDDIKIKYLFSQCKPDLVILSHWDLDHILGVAYSKNSLFQVNWIAPSMQDLYEGQYSISATRLAKYLCWKRKLFLVEEELNGKEVYNSGSFQMWKGAGEENTKKSKKNGRIVLIKGVEISGLNKANNVGLIIKLTNNSNNMLLPGDCEYQMLPSKIYSRNIRYDNIVVPHHASKMLLLRLRRHSKSKDLKDKAFISAGSNCYKPEHPWTEHIKYLKRIKYNVYKTSCDCTNGYYIKIDLATNSIS